MTKNDLKQLLADLSAAQGAPLAEQPLLAARLAAAESFLQLDSTVFGELRTCGECGGSGEVETGIGMAPCDTCHGAGTIIV